MKEFLSVSSDDFETMTYDALLEVWRQNHEYFTSTLSRYAPWKKKGRRLPELGLHGTGQKSLEAIQDPNNDSEWTGSCMVFNDPAGSTRSDAALALQFSTRIPFNFALRDGKQQAAGGVIVLNLGGRINRWFHPDESGTFLAIGEYEPVRFGCILEKVSDHDLKPRRLDLQVSLNELREMTLGVIRIDELPKYNLPIGNGLDKRLFSTLLTEQEVLKRSFDLLGIL